MKKAINANDKRILIDLNDEMQKSIDQVAEFRGIPPKRLIESFVCLCLLKESCIPEETKQKLRIRHTRLMSKKKWLTK